MTFFNILHSLLTMTFSKNILYYYLQIQQIVMRSMKTTAVYISYGFVYDTIIIIQSGLYTHKAFAVLETNQANGKCVNVCNEPLRHNEPSSLIIKQQRKMKGDEETDNREIERGCENTFVLYFVVVVVVVDPSLKCIST